MTFFPFFSFLLKEFLHNQKIYEINRNILLKFTHYVGIIKSLDPNPYIAIATMAGSGSIYRMYRYRSTTLSGSLPEEWDSCDDGGGPLHVRHPLAGGEGERVHATQVRHVNDGQFVLLLIIRHLESAGMKCV